MEEMKTLTIGDTTYEIVDETARAEAAASVKTINGNAPDSNGNVEVEGGSDGDFRQYGLGETANIVEIPSDYALGDLKRSGWYTVRLSYGTVDFGDGSTANKFLLRVETGESEQYTSVTKQTAMFSSYPGGEEYIRYCKNGYDWTAWEKVVHHPKNLTFKGAVNATYDGSEAVEVEIPQGGGGGSAEWNISTVTTTEEVASVRIDTPTTYEEIRFFIKLPAALKVNINVDVHGSSKYVNYNKKPLYNTANLTYAIYAWYTPEDKNGQTRFDAVYFAGGNAGVYPLGGAYRAEDPTPKITFAPHDSGAVFAVGSKFAVMWR